MSILSAVVVAVVTVASQPKYEAARSTQNNNKTNGIGFKSEYTLKPVGAHRHRCEREPVSQPNKYIAQVEHSTVHEYHRQWHLLTLYVCLVRTHAHQTYVGDSFANIFNVCRPSDFTKTISIALRKSMSRFGHRKLFKQKI